MKMKLGAIDKLKSLSYSNYSALLKKTLPSLHGLPEPSPFLLIAGHKLPWKETPKSPTQPLLYIGDLKQWLKWIKAEKLKPDEYAYGLCKVDLKSDKAQIKLVTEKGKLSKPTELKALQKVFKGMKPKVFFEPVEAFQQSSKGTDPKAHLPLAKTLLERHQQFGLIQKQLKGKLAAAKKTKLQENRTKLIQSITQVCTQWKQQVIDTKVNTSTHPNLSKAQDVYTTWAKQLKLDSPPTTPPKGNTNQQYHTKASKDREHLEASMDGIHTAAKIDEHLRDLIAHAQKWAKALKAEKKSTSKELKELQQYVTAAQKEWKTVRPLYANWMEKKQAIEKLGYTEKRHRELEAALAKI